MEGKVKAVLNTGGNFAADKVIWQQKNEHITALGHVKVVKDAYTAVADEVRTTSAFQKFNLKGHAKVTKGGE